MVFYTWGCGGSISVRICLIGPGYCVIQSVCRGAAGLAPLGVGYALYRSKA